MAETFLVARNPEPDSTLPYLIRLPLGGGELVLKARETWPRTAAVYCHPAGGWPVDAEIVEEVPIRSCVRRGVAIDLLLDRARESRSQLVFTRIQGGREGIFWQTARTTAKARPGIRLPTRRAGGHRELEMVDTRERYPYRFAHQQATIRRHPLPAVDYAVSLDGEIVGAVERKTLADLTSRLVEGQLAYLLADLAALPRSAVVVEDRYTDLFKLDHVQPWWVADLLATVIVRGPTSPILSCKTRPLAEEWTSRRPQGSSQRRRRSWRPASC